MSKRHPRAHRVAALWICLLTIWTQFLAPAAALGAMQPPDPFSVICSHATDNHHPDDHAPGDHGDPAQHRCCPLCHIHALDVLGDRQLHFTRLDYPLRSPRRWPSSLVLHLSAAEERPGRPRGPPLA